MHCPGASCWLTTTTWNSGRWRIACASAGFQVARAMNGEEALALLSQQWYPLVITDWQMPVMDGIALTETLRGRGLDDTFVIMLTMRGADIDYGRGYLSGVDDYLTKKASDAELFARIHAAFNTLALRRSLKETQAALEESVSIDALQAHSRRASCIRDCIRNFVAHSAMAGSSPSSSSTSDAMKGRRRRRPRRCAASCRQSIPLCARMSTGSAVSMRAQAPRSLSCCPKPASRKRPLSRIAC